MRKRKKYVKFRHKVVSFILKPFIRIYCYLKYGYTYKKCEQINKRPCLILYNHQTGFDQFFIAIAFKKTPYFVATEDIASLGAISRILKYLVSPISFKKSTQDMRAVKECLWYAREKASIAISPEGNRTYSGKTECMKPSIAKLAKALKYPVVIFKLDGGYGVQPRWSNKVRKGKMTGHVETIIEPSEVEEMTSDELFNLIQEKLFVNESHSLNEYKSKHLAEYLERVLYVCPHCGLTKFHSSGNLVKCLSCEETYEYNSHLEFVSKKGEVPFKDVNEWYEYQKGYLCDLDLNRFSNEVIFMDEVCFSEVIVYCKKNILLEKATIKLYKNRFVINSDDIEFVFKFEEIQATSVLGKNKMNIYQDDKIYQIKGDVHYNALKYVNFYYYYTNNLKGENHDHQQFLGL